MLKKTQRKIAQIKISNRNVLFMHDWNFNHDATSENDITTLIASIKVLYSRSFNNIKAAWEKKCIL